MEYYNIYIGKDSARNVIEELGKVEMVQFVDLNQERGNAKTLFNKEIRYLEKMKLKLNAIAEEIESRDVAIAEGLNNTTQNINEVEDQLEEAFLRLQNLKEIEAETDEYLLRLKEDRFILKECEAFFGEEVEEGDSYVVHLGYLIGIISKGKSQIFDSVVFNLLRRNFVIHKSDIFLGKEENKTCYIVLTHGGESLSKANKIFCSLGGRVHNMKEGKYREITKGVLTVTSLISQITRVSANNKEALREFLENISRKVRDWKFVISKEIEIFRTLNFFQGDYQLDNPRMVEGDKEPVGGRGLGESVEETTIIGDAWIPKRFRTKFEELIQTVNEGVGPVSFERTVTAATPPTFIVTNEYTDLYQQLNNMFETPGYKEINPGIFILFTFPALFGIMFSDAFHGLLLLLLSAWLFWKKARIGEGRASPLISTMIEGRYVLLSLGVSGVYFGLLFNEFGSVALPLFKSQVLGQASFYPFGIDWGWREARNRSEFINNLKMKMAVVVGTIHMGFGIVLAAINAISSIEKVKLYTEIFPQILAFSSFNGYIVFLIFFKWVVLGRSGGEKAKVSLIEVLVEMYTSPLKPTRLYSGQGYVQRLLFSTTISSSIWLVVSKPLYFVIARRKKIEWGTFMIEHFIHSMEFGVGLISNTASYLRLWAVSLAHSTLTEILHERTFGHSLLAGIALSPVYALIVVTLLCGMEGVSTALHALRLNWIEFNSKFVAGKGIPFAPLAFREEIDTDDR